MKRALFRQFCEPDCTINAGRFMNCAAAGSGKLYTTHNKLLLTLTFVLLLWFFISNDSERKKKNVARVFFFFSNETVMYYISQATSLVDGTTVIGRLRFSALS